MSDFVSDYSKKQTLQISNDAFCFLYYGEEPLDEGNLEEANEVSEMFSNNFYIEDDWKAVDGSGLIECTFVPYAEGQAGYDEYEDLTKYIQQQIKWLDADHIRVWWFNSQTGTRELRGDFKVYANEYGLKCFHAGNQDEDFVAGKMSLHFLKNFKKRAA